MWLTVRQTTENPLFSDDATISDYAKEAVYALKNSGAVSGYGENDFRPLGNATRAEAAAMIQKYCNNIGR